MADPYFIRSVSPAPQRRPSDAIWGLVSGYADRLRRSFVLPMIEAYSDDSGRGQPPVFVYAGWVSTVDKWAEFANAWEQALLIPPSVRFFKMKDAAALEGEFGRFDETLRNERLSILMDIINDYVDYGVSVSVRQDHYTEVFDRVLSITYDSPQQFAATHLMARIVGWERMDLRNSKVKFIFDEMNATEEAEIQHFWNLTRQRGPAWVRRRIGRVVVEDDEDILPLQAADILAWLTRRVFDEISQKNEELGFAEEVRQLIKVRHEICHFDKLNLPKNLDDLTRFSPIAVSYEGRKQRSKRLRPYRRHD